MTDDDKSLEERLSEKMDKTLSRLESKGKWVPYSGPRGGEGWRNAATGETVYTDEAPGESSNPAEVEEALKNVLGENAKHLMEGAQGDTVQAMRGLAREEPGIAKEVIQEVNEVQGPEIARLEDEAVHGFEVSSTDDGVFMDRDDGSTVKITQTDDGWDVTAGDESVASGVDATLAEEMAIDAMQVAGPSEGPSIDAEYGPLSGSASQVLADASDDEVQDAAEYLLGGDWSGSTGDKLREDLANSAADEGEILDALGSDVEAAPPSNKEIGAAADAVTDAVRGNTNEVTYDVISETLSSDSFAGDVDAALVDKVAEVFGVGRQNDVSEKLDKAIDTAFSHLIGKSNWTEETGPGGATRWVNNAGDVRYRKPAGADDSGGSASQADDPVDALGGSDEVPDAFDTTTTIAGMPEDEQVRIAEEYANGQGVFEGEPDSTEIASSMSEVDRAELALELQDDGPEPESEPEDAPELDVRPPTTDEAAQAVSKNISQGTIGTQERVEEMFDEVAGVDVNGSSTGDATSAFEGMTDEQIVEAVNEYPDLFQTRETIGGASGGEVRAIDDGPSFDWTDDSQGPPKDASEIASQIDESHIPDSELGTTGSIDGSPFASVPGGQLLQSGNGDFIMRDGSDGQGEIRARFDDVNDLLDEAKRTYQNSYPAGDLKDGLNSAIGGDLEGKLDRAFDDAFSHLE